MARITQSAKVMIRLTERVTEFVVEFVADVVVEFVGGDVSRVGDILQHTATHYSTLQHTATHCNTLQHTEFVVEFSGKTCVTCGGGVAQMGESCDI